MTQTPLMLISFPYYLSDPCLFSPRHWGLQEAKSTGLTASLGLLKRDEAQVITDYRIIADAHDCIML